MAKNTQYGIDSNICVPAFKEPVESRLSSPFGAVVIIRQEDVLYITPEILPHPESNEHKWHGWEALQRPLGRITVETDLPEGQSSQEERLLYNKDLSEIKYDPLGYSFIYKTGKISVRILDRPAVMVIAEPGPVRIRRGNWNADANKSYWYAKSIYKDSPVYCALIPHGRKDSKDANSIIAEGFSICWAKTPEQLAQIADSLSDINSVLSSTLAWQTAGTQYPRFEGEEALVKSFEMAKRARFSMKYPFGGCFAALDEYRNIWVRDSGIATVFTALGGNDYGLKRWTDYIMQNPTPVIDEGTNYLTFQTFPNGQDFKCESDGPFFAVMSAYASWKLAGDKSCLAKWYPILDSSCEFLRRKAFDSEKKLYMDLYVVESPVIRTEESEKWWDGAWPNQPASPVTYSSIYQNNIMYAVHLMLAEMAAELGKTDQKIKHLMFAEELAAAIDSHLWKQQEGHYLWAVRKWPDGRTEELDWDYIVPLYDSGMCSVWAFTFFPMTPNPKKSFQSLDGMLHQVYDTFGGKGRNLYFAPSLAHAAYAYTIAGDFEKSRALLNLIHKSSQNVYKVNENQMNASYYMKGALCERTDAQIHVPYPWTMAAYMHAALSMIASMDYHGITVIPSSNVERAYGIQFQKSVFDINICSRAEVQAKQSEPTGIILNGKTVPYTLKIPSILLTSGVKSAISLLYDSNACPVLRHTAFELRQVKTSSDKIEYGLSGYGSSVLRFNEYVLKEAIDVRDEHGESMPFDYWVSSGGHCISVFGKGLFNVIIHLEQNDGKN